MKKKENRISLEFVSDLKFTEFSVLVFSYVRRFLHMEEDEFFKVEISLREVINNAILHGNKSDKAKRVFVTFKWSKKWLYLNIRDENSDAVDFNAINKQLEDNDILAFSGRGILIMKSYMDKVKFIPSAGGGTEIVMEKKL